MFNLQGNELIIILLLALVVLGPEKLPEAMRKLGEFVAQLKKMSAGFQQEFKAAVDEPMREVRDTANMLRDSVDFRKMQDGTRTEKPKSGDMAAVTPDPEPTSESTAGPTPEPAEPAAETAVEVAPADPTLEPTTDVPFAPGESNDVPVEAPEPVADEPSVTVDPPIERPIELPSDPPAERPIELPADPPADPPADEVTSEVRSE